MADNNRQQVPAASDALPVQLAERNLYPPSRCSPAFASQLPEGVSVWSCYPGSWRLVERTGGTVPAALTGIDQQIHVHYVIVDDADALIRTHRETISRVMNYGDVEGLVKGLPDIPLSMVVRGQVDQDGKIAGSSIYLIDAEKGILCDLAKPDALNPWTVCTIPMSPRMLEVQFPNRLIGKIDQLLARLEALASIVERSHHG